MTRDWDGLHVLADDDPRWPLDPIEMAKLACAGGAPVVQLRVKHATDRLALEWAREIRRITRQHGARFVMNDRFDLALASEADAVHLGQGDLPPQAVPANARARLSVGRSTHDTAQARAALEESVDYVAFGPLFGTTSKDSEYAARDLASLAEVVEIAGSLPVVAIGGIDASRIGSVARAGARGAAVISAVALAEDPMRATQELIARMESG